MKWTIPGKTFLLGEYAALQGGSAILITTHPCFDFSLTTENTNDTIHPSSPAGHWIANNLIKQSYFWHDPYVLGGFGASSAQFIGAYLASCYLNKHAPDCNHLLESYLKSSWFGKGLKPSGYDVLAQTQKGCVYINKNKDLIEIFDWSFNDIAFLLVHTGKKLSTHTHLLDNINEIPEKILSQITQMGKKSFVLNQSDLLIDAVNSYQQALEKLNLVSTHTLQYIRDLKQPDVLAIKGCGAMGADVLILLVKQEDLDRKRMMLMNEGWNVMATSHDLYRQTPLLKIKTNKILEILP